MQVKRDSRYLIQKMKRRSFSPTILIGTIAGYGKKYITTTLGRHSMSEDERRKIKREIETMMLHIDQIDQMCYQASNMLHNMREKMLDKEDELNKFLYTMQRS